MKYFIPIATLLMLSGCSTGVMQIPSSEVIDSTGKVITKTASTVGDTSSYRTHEKYAAWQTAYKEYTKAYEASGFHMDLTMIKIKTTDGVMQIPVISSIVYRDRPEFHAPADLKDHPVWHSLDNAVNKITPWGFGTWAATSIVGSMRDMAMKPTYSGPVQMSGSYNSAGHDVTAYNGPLQQDQSARTNSQGQNPMSDQQVTPTCNEALIAAIPGCSSCESYLDGRCSVKP